MENQKYNKSKARVNSRFSGFAILSTFILTVTYTFQNREIETIVNYSLWIAGVLLGFAIFGTIIFTKRHEWTKPDKVTVLILFLVPIMVALGGLFYYSIAASVVDLYKWVRSPRISKNGVVLITICLSLSLGLLLFFFRLKLRAVYGLTETVVGLGIAGLKTQNINHQFDAEFYLAILTASIYLVVRGLDNFHQGITKEPRDKVIMKILYYFRRR